MMKKIASLALASICFVASAQSTYKVIAPTPDVEKGTIAYIVNYDTGERIDSATVADEKAVFKGAIDDPVMARIIVGANRYGTFVLEEGTLTINQDTKMGVGTMLNDQLKSIVDQLTEIETKARDAKDSSEIEKLLDQYLDIERNAIIDNIDNPISMFVFLDYSNTVDMNKALELTELYPDLKEYKKVQKFIDSVNSKLATSEGKKFIDFEVTYDGVTKKLSDYVGKGDYVLVDFWASWCGPCMREIENLKSIYKEYEGKGLKILGVAVWDEPENTLAAIKRKNIPWECIINAQYIPTDLYGIQGIPCIILFGPDGTILSRDKQGEQLREDIARAIKR